MYPTKSVFVTQVSEPRASRGRGPQARGLPTGCREKGGSVIPLKEVDRAVDGPQVQLRTAVAESTPSRAA